MTGLRSATPMLIGLAIACGAGGCGGGNADACRQVPPCGGEVVGTWSFSSACTTQPPIPAPLCAGAAVRASSFSVSGSATYGADLTYGVDVTESGTIEVSVPDSCLTMSTCDRITPQVSIGVNVRCADSDAGCVCTFVLLPFSTTETGTYTTAGSLLTLTPAGGSPSSISYCVANDRLHTITLDPTMTTPTGQPAIIGDVVAVRK